MQTNPILNREERINAGTGSGFKTVRSFQLRNITIQIPTGYLCGLAGENGAGKTSLLHMLLGLYRPDSGTVRIDGKIYEENEKEIRQQTGIVLAEDLLHPAFSLLQNGRYYGSFIMDTRRSVLWKN